MNALVNSQLAALQKLKEPGSFRRAPIYSVLQPSDIKQETCYSERLRHS